MFMKTSQLKLAKSINRTTQGKNLSIVSVPADKQMRAKKPPDAINEYLRYAPVPRTLMSNEAKLQRAKYCRRLFSGDHGNIEIMLESTVEFRGVGSVGLFSFL